MRFAIPRACPVRRLMLSRRMRYGSNALVLTCAVVAIVLMVNFIVARHPAKLDLTQNKMYTLSEETRQVLRKVDRDIKITAFFPEGDAMGEMVKDLLKEYTRLSPNISVSFVDPDKNPSLAKRYEITAYGTSVVESGSKSRKVMQYDLVEYSGESQMPGFAGEQAFTRAIIGVLQEEEKSVYFLVGHDERDLVQDYWQARSFLEGEGYTTKTVNLATEGKVPQDAALLVIAGPQKDLAPKEVEAVQDYVNRGGSVMVLAEPLRQKGQLSNLKAMVARWGVGMNDDVVIDPASHYFLDAGSPIPEVRYHDITMKLVTEKLGCVLPRSRSLYEVKDTRDSGVTLTALLETSGESWGETDLTAKRVLFDAKADIKGPLVLAYAVERALEPKAEAKEAGETQAGSAGDSAKETAGATGAGSAGSRARMLVVGNASFLDNDVVTFQGNIDFFMNSVGWLVGKEESITIRAKSPSFSRVYLTGQQASLVFYSTVVGLPLLFVLVGGGIWLRRRNL
ncbi:MAG: GldG family protein [Firmicutes bacterium]|nr:GldG family protein [Bacillota bacterium]